MSVHELKSKLDAQENFKLIDCRENDEYEYAHIEGSILVPLSQFQARFKDVLGPEDEIVVHCHHGGRSQKACEFLFSMGYKNVANVTGGIDSWSVEIDESVKRY